jgi:hypothetical protein
MGFMLHQIKHKSNFNFTQTHTCLSFPKNATMTTQEQKDKVQSFVDKVAEIEGVASAYIDDYGRFGNFSVVIVKEKRSRINFRHINPRARKLAREHGLIWRSNELYPTNKNVNMVDIDCQPYSPEANKFQEQLDNPEKYGEDGLLK